MSDLRKKQSTLTLNLFTDNLKFFIWGDSAQAIADCANFLGLKNIGFQIEWVNAQGEIPPALSKYSKVLHSSSKPNIEKIIACDVALIAFQDTTLSEKLMNDLKAHKVLTINFLSETKPGNASLPTSFMQDDLEVALQANGRNDRKVRAFKDYLQRHTQDLLDTTLLVVGTDHNFLDLQAREPYHLQSPKYEIISEQLGLVSGVQEFFILNTCNRVEVYAIASRSPKTVQMICHLLNFDHLGENQYYIKYDANAFTHMGLVLSGLLSQIPGETHVVQQMKKAIEVAKQNKMLGGLLQQVFDNGLFVSKNIRQKTTSMLNHYEIEDLSVKYAHVAAKHIENKSILILGAGVVGQGLVDRLLMHQPKEIKLVYRTNKPDLDKFNNQKVSAYQIGELNAILPFADTIFSAVSTSRFILHTSHIPFFKKESPVLIIDVCVPRSVDSSIQNECHNVCIADIESLKKWYLGVIKNYEAIKKIGLDEINLRIGRYEKILDKEWMQEQ